MAEVAIQDVVEVIRKTGRHEWIGEFEVKNGLEPSKGLCGLG